MSLFEFGKLIVAELMIGYVLIGLSACIGSKVYKWTIPWAILGVIILWPFLVYMGIKNGTFWEAPNEEK